MLISICIPTYSRLAYLQKAVDSALLQTYSEIEICVSQDPKPNGPDLDIYEWSIAKSAMCPKVKYNLNEFNLGLAGNWNKVVDMALGEYVIIIGDDDILNPDFIEKLHVQIIKHNVDVVFSNQYFIDGNGDILNVLTEELNIKYARNKLETGVIEHPIATVLRNSVPISASLIRRDLLLRFPYDVTLNTPELEVFLKIAISGGTYAYVNEKLACYRVHAQSATSAGLMVSKFLKNLIDIPVPVEYEHYKHEMISSSIIPSINMALKDGDKKLASQLLASSYYPSKWQIRFVQCLLLIVPTPIARFLLKRH